MDEIGIRGHLDQLGFGTDHKVNRDCRILVHIQRDAFLHVFLEAFGFDFQLVVADREFQQNVCAGPIRSCRAYESGFSLLSAH